FWRDYNLQPGPSDVWATAWIGSCLCGCRSFNDSTGRALAMAVRAISSAVKQGGWGYNRSTGPDADSTAWTCRFLAACNVPLRSMTKEALSRYVDTSGAAHTFCEPGAGSWGEAHA